MKNELLALAKDVGEHVSYLGELGVTGVEDSSASVQLTNVRQPGSEIPVPVEDPILRRSAEASLKADVSPSSVSQVPSASGAPSSSHVQSEMISPPSTRLPKRPPKPPQETLFGEIAAPVKVGLPCANETLEDIWNDIGDCTRCPLAAGRTHIVNSHGNRNARLMFVGEAPGADEDIQARPFVGRAGQLLTKIIEAIGIKREEVLIGNVNRCRPPQNRQPTLEEASTCKPFILREIAVVRPEVIVVLGNTAMKNLLDAKEGITKLRGQFQDYKGIKVMPTFHPAYLLRDPSKKREAWADMKTVRAYLDSVTPKD